jgi:AraC-like DNA-binding protein
MNRFPESFKSDDGNEISEFAFDVTHGHSHPRLMVRWCAREVLGTRDSIDMPPNSPYSILKFCVQGAGEYTSGDQTWQIKPHMAFWNLCGTETHLKRTSEEPLVSYLVMVFGDEVPPMFRQHLHCDVGAIELLNPREVSDLFEEMMSEGLTEGHHLSANCANFAKILFRRVDSNMVGSFNKNALARKTFYRCKKYIDQNFIEVKTLTEVAIACGVTVQYLCYLFNLFYSTTPYDYITRLKMGKAEFLLLDDKLPVGEIALAVGYKDAGLFSRNFKMAFGKSPRHYRKSMMGQA